MDELEKAVNDITGGEGWWKSGTGETFLSSMAIDEVLSLELIEILPLPPEPPVKEKKKRQWFFGPF